MEYSVVPWHGDTFALLIACCGRSSQVLFGLGPTPGAIKHALPLFAGDVDTISLFPNVLHVAPNQPNGEFEVTFRTVALEDGPFRN